MDSTLKCKNNEFPLCILGITDAPQQFHPLSLNVTSHRTAVIYCKVLIGFKDLLEDIDPSVKFDRDYLMADCEIAERSALSKYYSHATHLICFLHVQNNCREH